MRKHILFLAIATAVALVPFVQAGGKTYGVGVKGAAKTTSMATILADPDAWVGKKVRIEGKVVDVCPMKGCWMELEEAKNGAKMKVKVDDGVIIFPVNAKGKLAVAEGTIESIPMTRERYIAWLEHLAEEKGEKFDVSTLGEGPYRIFQLKGAGAEIKD